MHSPANLTVRAPLARYILLPPGQKPRGLRRLAHKLAKTLFFLVHQRLGIAAPGDMRFRNGARFTVNCANTAFLDFAARSAVDGSLEPEVSALFEKLAPHLRTVYDIGANWGYFSVLLGTHPQFRGAVHAFEISPATFRDLEHCIAGAGLETVVTCHGFGLSDRDSSVFVSEGRHSMLTRVLPAGSAGMAALVRRLDTLGLPPPDMIKVDVEDHEAAVFRGAREILRAVKPLIVFESRSPALTEPLELLAAAGYGFRRLQVKEASLIADQIEIADRCRVPHALNLLAVHQARNDLLSHL